VTARSLQSALGLLARGIQGGFWAYRAHQRVKLNLQLDPGGARLTLPPPSLPRHAGRGVVIMLEARRATCLERSLVLQAWFAAHGPAPDVIVGVAKNGNRVKAHAWLAGSDEGAGFVELHRFSHS
jgi:hypothetical protein